MNVFKLMRQVVTYSGFNWSYGSKKINWNNVYYIGGIVDSLNFKRIDVLSVLNASVTMYYINSWEKYILTLVTDWSLQIYKKSEISVLACV